MMDAILFLPPARENQILKKEKKRKNIRIYILHMEQDTKATERIL